MSILVGVRIPSAPRAAEGVALICLEDFRLRSSVILKR